MLKIDGSHGEGGGQIIRSGITLSILTGQPVEFINIRASRPKPGLSYQHLAAVKAAASICGGEAKGANLRSTSFTFIPGKVRPGEFRIDIGTAGSVILVLQTILFPLVFSGGVSKITIKGGTHVSWSPCYHYMDKVFVPILAAMGIRVTLTLLRWGWYPKGGGVVEAVIHSSEQLNPLIIGERLERFPEVQAISASSKLPPHVRERQAAALHDDLSKNGIKVNIEEEEVESASAGSLVFCWVSSPDCYCGFTGLGERGKRAENVAREVAWQVKRFLKSGASVDMHLSDQLIIPSALSNSQSSWTTDSISDHLKTNAWLVEQFGLGPVRMELDESGQYLNIG